MAMEQQEHQGVHLLPVQNLQPLVEGDDVAQLHGA
jgi:hypothetical protein